MNKIKLLIVDDHLLVRTGITSLLSDQTDIEITGEASSGEEAIEKVNSSEPDVILMDISMEGISGLKAAELIKQDHPDIKIIMLTMHDENEYIYNALKIKVNGFLHKSAGKNEIAEAVRSCAEGNVYIGRNITEILAEYFVGEVQTEGKVLLLTKREKEILSCIAADFTTNEIAGHFSISPRTVDTHRSNLIQKYNLKNAQGLYRFAADYVRNSRKKNSLS
jgi:two-component system, NarL family, response regulator NreC